MKKLLALVMALVLILAATTALAAKPTAKIEKASKNQTVAPGGTITWTFKLNSGSYKKKNGAYNAKLDILILNGNDHAGNTSWVWTGTQKYSCTAKLEKNAPTGKYTLKYTTYYRTKATAAWKKAKTQSTKFTVKK